MNNIDITIDFERGKPANTNLDATPTEVEELIGEVSAKNEIYVDMIASGPAGPKGEPGENAYKIWLSIGNTGTIEEFLDSLAVSQYEHPETHSADMIEETEDRQFMSTLEKIQALSTFSHKQMPASSEWVIEHGLNKYPSVTVVDSNMRAVMGSVVYLSENELVISFIGEFSGSAFLN